MHAKSGLGQTDQGAVEFAKSLTLYKTANFPPGFPPPKGEMCFVNRYLGERFILLPSFITGSTLRDQA
ncbi:MAG: hypothetical protein DSY91_07560 [Deltaproteobacteria bacterium]|nr:MAG: hypothetical protein DSY91_07560 [Deltaproteobacteria bacterium]